MAGPNNPSGQIVGKLGRLLVYQGGTNLIEDEVTMDTYTVSEDTADIPDKSSTARGRTAREGGFTRAKLSFKGYADLISNNPFAVASRNLRAGNKSTMMAWLNASLSYFFPSMLIERSKVSSTSNKRVELEMDLWADGDYDLPGESTYADGGVYPNAAAAATGEIAGKLSRFYLDISSAPLELFVDEVSIEDTVDVVWDESTGLAGIPNCDGGFGDGKLNVKLYMSHIASLMPYNLGLKRGDKILDTLFLVSGTSANLAAAVGTYFPSLQILKVEMTEDQTSRAMLNLEFGLDGPYNNFGDSLVGDI